VRRATTALVALALAIFPAAAPAAAPPVVGGLTFSDAPPLSQGAWWDALDTGGAVFYRVHVPGGTAPKATVTLDLGALDPSETGGSSLDVKVYDSLRRPVAEGQSLGPGDPTTHVKSATATAPRPAAVEGDWYVSAKVNDFLPDGAPPVQLPLGVNVALASRDTTAPRPPAAKASSGSGTSWALFAALCVAGAAVGVLGGAALRRR
jgi:hypothetical protein